MNYFNKQESFDDTQLDSLNQQKVASMVKALPDEEVSLAWRSGLNVKIMAAQAAKKKKRVTKIFAWGSSLSAGIVATGYIVLMANTAAVIPTSTSRSESVAFASELVKAHQESVVLASVSGTGATIHETSLTEDPYSPVDELL